MSAKHFLSLILVAGLAGAGGWLLAGRQPAARDPHAADAEPAGGKIYSCSMHPQIRSSKPGRCPICLMELAPLGQGGGGLAAAAGTVPLSPSVISVLNVQTSEVKRQLLARALRVAGTIDDDDMRHRRLSAYVEGRIEKLFINYIGAEVTAGQPLATFYSPMLLAMEREYAALRQTKPAADAPLLAREHEHLLAAATQRLKRLGLNDVQIAALDQKPAGAATSELVAPMTGTVITRDVYEGQYVKEGDRLFELADFSRMWFRFDAYERDLAWIRVGQRVDVTTPSVPGKVYTNAVITFIDPNLDDKTRSAKVRVELENPLVERGGKLQRELYHRLYAEGVVRIEIPEVLTIPRSAVLSPAGQPVVYVDRGGGVYEQRALRLGRSGDDLWEVLEGLKAGERVVTAGNLLIDAQAQLSFGSVMGIRPAATNATERGAGTGLPPLTAAQSSAARALVNAADAVNVALSKASVPDFNREVAQLVAVLPGLTQAFAEAAEWSALIQPVVAAGRLGVAKDLVEARQMFEPFSVAAVALARGFRAQGAEFGTLKFYECPMTKRAFPGAPKKSQWLQTQGPLRNPFLAPDMIDCGTELK